MKYVVYRLTNRATKMVQYHPVIFAEHTCHCDVVVQPPGPGWQSVPVSAGFFHLSGGRVNVTGESESLKLRPGHMDATLISHVLAGSGTMSFTEL